MARKPKTKNKKWPDTVGKWSQDPEYTSAGDCCVAYAAHGYGGYGPISLVTASEDEDNPGRFSAHVRYTTYRLPEWDDQDYEGLTRQGVLDLLTYRSKVRKMTAKELARIGASRKAQKGVQWQQALIELDRRGKGPDGKRKGKAREPFTPLWNPRRTKKRR